MIESYLAYALTNYVDLNKIASFFGINKKISWEEPLILTSAELKHHFSKIKDSQKIYIYSFGSIIFINFNHSEIQNSLKLLKNFIKDIKIASMDKFTDSYAVKIVENTDLILNNDELITGRYNPYFSDIISVVLAKSVALERIEDNIDRILDDIEDIIDFMEKGQFKIKDSKMAKLASQILKFKYYTISYIMLLDKPDITWENMELENLYLKMSELFELNERYEMIKHKTEMLLDVTDIFTGLTYYNREIKLEWMIVILIIIEILLSLFQLFFLK